MASRCMMMLDCVDAKANFLLKKHARNRPLGDIQAKHNISLLEPQLLVQSVDVNLYTDGAKPYRVMSANDIIEDQHRMMHQLPSKSTPRRYQDWTGAAVSAPVRRRTQPRSLDQSNNQPQISDILAVSSSYTRPASSPESKRPVIKPRRPNTSGKTKKSRPEFMKIKFDPELLESARNYQSSTNEIRRQFEESIDFSEGNFVRGKKKVDSSVGSVDSSGQWLTFGGGSIDDNAGGVLDAFTSMKEPEEYYIVEGSSGSHLAQKIKGGDKLRIGKNGAVQATDFKIKRDRFDTIYHKYENEFGKEMADVKQPVPLCWEDQVAWEKVKVIKPSESKENSPRTNLCETHPVKFEKLIKGEPQRPKLARANNKNNKYRVQTATKTRTRIDGKNTVMGEISIGRGLGQEFDPDYEDPLRYEEIIAKAVASSIENGKKHVQRKRVVKTYQYPKWQEKSPCEYSDTMVASPREYLRSVSKMSMAESTVNTAGEMRQYVHRQVSTPMHLSHDPELSIIAPGQRDKTQPDYDRSPSPTRPPTATPLHRTSARAGVSITPHGVPGETEFIKIATSLKNPHHSNLPVPVRQVPSGRQKYIIQVEDSNRSHYDNSQDGGQYNGYMDGMSAVGYGLERFHNSRYSVNSSDSDNTARMRANTPASLTSSRPLSASSGDEHHHHVSVNVPTGGATSLASSDVNSMSDFLEFETVNTVQIVPQHTPIPEESNELKAESEFSRPSSLRPSTVISKSMGTSRPSTSSSLRSDLLSVQDDHDSSIENSPEKTIPNDQIDHVTNKLNGANISNSQSNGSHDSTDQPFSGVSKTHDTGISADTKQLIESVTVNESRPENIQKILDENQKKNKCDEDPAMELKKLREKIKTDLKQSQISAEAEIQNLYMQQQFD